MLSRKIVNAYCELLDNGFCWVDNGDDLYELQRECRKNQIMITSTGDYERDEANDYHLKIKVVHLGD